MSEQALSILHVAVPAAAGGLERVLHALALGQHRTGHRVRVVAVVEPGEDDHPFVRPLQAAGVTVDVLAIPPRAYLRERRRVAQLLAVEPTDVLHTHGFRPDVLDSGLGLKRGIATVTTEHGMSKMGGKTAIYEWLQTRALRRFDAVIAVSARIASQLPSQGIAPARVHVVPNAWADDVDFLERDDARRALDLPRDAYVLGWIGRLIGAKGADVFLNAIARLPQDHLVVIIGDGSERAALETQARRLGLESSVRFLGLRNDAARYMKAFDVFPLSSRTEGTPIVLLEAMAAGVPVVATRVGGVPDVVRSAEALLLEPEDPVALADAIVAVRTDPVAAQVRVEAARTRLATHYALGPWLARYEAIYRDVVRARRE